MPVVTAGLFEIPCNVEPACLMPGVSAGERLHYQTLARHSRRAMQYLASRWLMRAHFGHELGVPPLDVPLRDTENGPPLLVGTDYRVGLSHSGSVCLCVASVHGAIGCDAEYRRPRRHMRDIASQYFHPAEAAWLNGLGDGQARSGFYQLWTLKEASQKALGLGLDGGLRLPAFELGPVMRCLVPPTEDNWIFASCVYDRAGDGYAMALAAAGVPSPLDFAVSRYAPTNNGPARTSVGMSWDIASAN